jgi:hypothetical protein
VAATEDAKEIVALVQAAREEEEEAPAGDVADVEVEQKGKVEEAAE